MLINYCKMTCKNINGKKLKKIKQFQESNTEKVYN